MAIITNGILGGGMDLVNGVSGEQGFAFVLLHGHPGNMSIFCFMRICLFLIGGFIEEA